VDPVRRAAVEILESWQQGHRHVEDLVEGLERRSGPDGAAEWAYVERRRLREIVYGTVRLHARYDHLVAALSDGTKSPPPRLQALFRVALHELVEMRSPDHAVVSEAVDLAHALRLPWAAGWVNALLRRAAREDLSAYFPSADVDPVAYAVTWHSHPRWLVERWHALLGAAEMLALCAANDERPAVYLRAAPGRRDALAAELRGFEWETRTVEGIPDALELQTRVPPAVLLESVEESCTIQDAAAQLVAPILAGAVGRTGRVLDACAAPGGKTLHLAHLLDGDARIVAADARTARLVRVGEALRRSGADGRVRLVAADGEALPFDGPLFDGVLVDVPCTGTGVLARRHDARWLRRPEDLVELPKLQARLFEAAIDATRPGGVVVYATCSLEPEENDEVVDSVLARREDVEEIGVEHAVDEEFRRGSRLQTWPHRHGIDGAFAACVRRTTDEVVS
jgi:16S rRNA (cytosine967-C5)-methyltransferase